MYWQIPALVACSLLAQALAQPAVAADGGDRLLRLDHYVGIRSTVPAIAGQTTAIYVREVVRAGSAMRNRPSANKVVLFIHGAGTPAEVSFDVPYKDYSWMEYLARAGFDVFAMDTTGYGRSTRPAAMSDPCNLASAAQAQFVPRLITAPCAATFTHEATTIATDWDHICEVVDYVRGLRGL